MYGPQSGRMGAEKKHFCDDLRSEWDLHNMGELVLGMGMVQYSPKIMHAQELLFASASRQLLAASCGSLRHNPTSRKNFFAVGS